MTDWQQSQPEARSELRCCELDTSSLSPHSNYHTRQIMQDSSLHNRPARVTYAHAPSHSNSRSTAEAQAQRRQLALDAQRQRRTHAFELARRAYEANRGEMGEAGQAIEELSLDSGFMTGATAMVDDGPVAGQYTDADEIEEDRPSGQEDATTQTS